MKNKHVARGRWGTAHASTSVDFTQRTSQWHIPPTFVLSQNVSTCACALVFSWGGGGVASRGRKGKGKNGEMDEGSSGALGVLIIHCSVVGSEPAISPRLYPCLMI